MRVIVVASTIGQFRTLERALAASGTEVTALALESDFRPAAGDPPCPAEIIDAQLLPTALQREPLASLPVLIADDGDLSTFERVGQMLAPALNPDQRLWHPASILASTPGALAGRAVTYGLPGAGNVIYQEILRRLLAMRRDAHDSRMEAWCGSGHILVCNALTKGLRAAGASGVSITYARPGRVAVLATFEDGTLFLPEVPSPIHGASSVFGTHSVPNSADVAAYPCQGGWAFLVVRHPLDIAISVAAKTSMDTMRANAAEHHISVAAARERHLQSRLADLSIMECHCIENEVFWRAAAQHRHDLRVLRYEDLMADPLTEVQRLAAIVGVTPSAAEVGEIAAIVGTTNLGPEGHLYKPGAGKGKRSLPASWVKRIGTGSIAEDAAAFGYEALRTERPHQLTGVLPGRADDWEAFYLHYSKEPPIREWLSDSHVVDCVAGVTAISKRRHLVDAWRHQVRDDAFLRLVLTSMAVHIDAGLPAAS